MRYTLMFGAPVHLRDGEFGTLNRIIVNNGVANQFTVSPSGLFSGPDRVVPISDVVEATAEGISLDCPQSEWKSYAAFHIERLLVSDQAAAPNLLQLAPRVETTSEVVDVPTAEAETQERAVSADSVALTRKTRVGDLGALAGMEINTGIPEQLLVEGGTTVPFEQVGVLDESHIVLGQVAGRHDGATAVERNAQPVERADGAVTPGSIGQERRHDPHAGPPDTTQPS